MTRMALGKRDFDASSSPATETKPSKKLCISDDAKTKKRKAGDIIIVSDDNSDTNKQPVSKRSRQTSAEEEGTKKKNNNSRTKKKAAKNKKKRDPFTSADEPLLQQVIDGTLPEGTTVPDRVRRKIPHVAMRIAYNERIGDHRWDAEEELLFQSHGLGSVVVDRPLPLYYAIAHAEYDDALIERMMRDYMAVHRGAVDGLWGGRPHHYKNSSNDGNDFNVYPPPLWHAVIHGRWGVVDMLLQLGARHDDRLRFGNLEELIGAKPITQPCPHKNVPHDACAAFRRRQCCDMYNYIIGSIDRLLVEEEAGAHATFEARMDNVEHCMLWVQDHRRDWIPRYDSNSNCGKRNRAFYIAPLVAAGFFRMLNRLGVREGMGAKHTKPTLDNYVRDIAWSRKTESVLGWLQSLPAGLHIKPRDFQRLLTPFVAPRHEDPKAEIVQGDGAYTRIGAILAAWARLLPDIDELNNDKDENSSAQVYRSWMAELTATQPWLWKWLVRLEAAKSRHGDEQLAKNVAALLNWHREVTRWATAQKKTGSDSITTEGVPAS
ncbi:hypothetical protein PG995_010180 [Apiospora arundinis]|uniref:Ankyrin repeat protein n=1 Tax=Apiospora arundinis TaxID=335852 RepID=A0ABR2ITL4_9PEZI